MYRRGRARWLRPDDGGRKVRYQVINAKYAVTGTKVGEEHTKIDPKQKVVS